MCFHPDFSPDKAAKINPNTPELLAALQVCSHLRGAEGQDPHPQLGADLCVPAEPTLGAHELCSSWLGGVLDTSGCWVMFWTLTHTNISFSPFFCHHTRSLCPDELVPPCELVVGSLQGFCLPAGSKKLLI